VGEKIVCMPIGELQSKGLEQYQGHLEVLFSFLKNSEKTSKDNEPENPLKLRKNAIDFI
jgi:hypothetical protein